jgi:hypothetical protein
MSQYVRGLVLFLGVAVAVCWAAYRAARWQGSGIPRDAWYHPDNLAAEGYPRPVR